MHGDGIEDFRSIFDRKADFLAFNSMPDGQIEPMTHVRFILFERYIHVLNQYEQEVWNTD
jgi:hypothetical protein